MLALGFRSTARVAAFLLLLAVAVLPQARAQVHHVPQELPTIQAAIDAAASGDTVLVDPGVYEEQIRIAGKDIVLGSRFLTTGDTSHVAFVKPRTPAAVGITSRRVPLSDFQAQSGTPSPAISVKPRLRSSRRTRPK